MCTQKMIILKLYAKSTDGLIVELLLLSLLIYEGYLNLLYLVVPKLHDN